jgi:hypothetical protein
LDGESQDAVKEAFRRIALATHFLFIACLAAEFW